MKTIVISILMLFSGFIFAGLPVTATLQGSRLSYIADEGSTVKKGAPLVLYGTSSTMNKIASAKAELQSAEADLKDKTGDLQRYTNLRGNNAASAEKLEEVKLQYNYAASSVALYKATIKSLEAKINMSVIPAPFDCKVTNVFLLVNSGTDYGQEIMEIEPVTASGTAKTIQQPDLSNIRIVSSTMYGGVINYLAENGALVKKGDFLVKIINPITEAEIDELKAKINYAERLVESSKSNFERYSKLKGKSSSLAYSESIELAYEEAKYKLAIAKKNLEYYEQYNASGIIEAPFDCKVVKVMMILKGGTEAGSHIMEIIPVKIPTSNHSQI